MENDLERDLKELRDTFNTGKTKEYSWRISQLRGLLHILEDRENDIFLALKKDLGKHHVEAYRDEVRWNSGEKYKLCSRKLEAMDGCQKDADWQVALLLDSPTLVTMCFLATNSFFGPPSVNCTLSRSMRRLRYRVVLILLMRTCWFEEFITVELHNSLFFSYLGVFVRTMSVVFTCHQSGSASNGVPTTLFEGVSYQALSVRSPTLKLRESVSLPLAAFPSSASLIPEPLGVVLIISTWNFPIGLSLEPLIGAIAAGNAVVLKPSELAPSCASFLAETIRDYLDNSAVKVIEGGTDKGEKLLQLKFDKIFFTGSKRVGRAILLAAAEHFTPVTLELGGKCPAVVDTISSSRDTNMAAKRIVWGKFGPCAGQCCVGIDYILTEKKYLPKLVELSKKYIKQCYGDDTADRTHSMSKIVNKRHFSRLKSLLDEPLVKSSIVYGGSLDEESLYIEPTILVDPPLDAEIMTEEIFGPLLPIITLERIEDSIEFIRARPKPLAIYAFTENETLQKRLISETSSGSIMMNDAILQYAVDTLPFGGVGGSGFGRYHGKYSFDNFSHEKRKYATEILERANMVRCHPCQTLVDTESKLGADGDPGSLADADWAGCPTTRQSTSTTLVYCETMSVVYLSSNLVQHQRTKHIKIDIHFVHDLVVAGQVWVLHVSSRYHYADIFTKGLPTTLFEEFRTSLSVRSPTAQTAGEC
ncbi:aldehyde dehydrogenase NAD(P)-dependent, Aldehyde/histidinol dehydrogenase [Artemisia annua]|uniref:aldehyde dehydrogenase (NAD(+)) n=1 Tax=Artemisia annua TaxID=35608 RepID=A0A2U1Q6B9_ARTAN|nr:aldehyde dehydrogenase NAD(P)-dependent, Aldehyde/histidinol dehydrogenase [Artemisia annua]